MPGSGSRTSSAQTKDWPGLAATLAAFDNTRLTRLLTLRPDLVSPPPRDWAMLASRAGAWPSARDTYRALDRAGQRVVEALCLLPQPSSLADLAALLGVAIDDDDLESALVRVEERALVFRTEAEVRLLPGLKQLDYPAGLGPPLASLLHTLTGPALDQMAIRLGAKPDKNMHQTKALIVGILSDPAEIMRVMEQAPAGAVDLAGRAATDGPLVSVAGGMYGLTDKTAAGWMANRGLLGVADYYTAVMPREPAVALRGGSVFAPNTLRRPPAKLSAVDVAKVDGAAAERATRVVADLVAILDDWSTAPPAVLKAGGLGIREVRRAAKLVERTEPETAQLIELAGAAGLVRVDIAGDTLPTTAYDEWLALESPARWAWLATSWLGAALHLSLAGAISTKDKPIAPLLPAAPDSVAAKRRRLVLGVLAEAAPGQALAPLHIRERVDWECPAVWAGGPAMPHTLVAWSVAEAELLGIVALGALSTAGRAVVDGRPQDAVVALAGLVPPVVDEFVIQADLTAVIAGEPAAAVRTELHLLGDVESKGAATVYRFTEGSLRRAFDAGRTAADLMAFLERHATRGVPQPLAYLLADLDRRFGNVRVGAVTSYLRSDDPALLAEVRQARLTAKLRLRPIAPTVLVTHADAATVTSTLQAAGYLPAQEAADGSLLLARPPVRRLPPAPPSAWRPPAPPEPAAVVADLRRKPVSQPMPEPIPAYFEPARAEPSRVRALRPAEIAKGPRAVRILLAQACDEYWVVRISYLNSSGRASEVTVEPTELDSRHLYGDCFPAGDERTFVVDRIEWARVLNQAEESTL